MQREFTRLKLDRASADRTIYDPTAPGAQPIIGRVLMRGLADEIEGRHFLVDGLDGRTHYVPIGTAHGDGLEVMGEGNGLALGAVVEIRPCFPAVREVDRTIAAVAAANAGCYDAGAHCRYDPAASEVFVEAHRRLEAMRRKSSVAERHADGSWSIARSSEAGRSVRKTR